MIFFKCKCKRKGKRKGIKIFQKRSILNQNSRLTNKKGELYFLIAKFPLYYRNIN